MKLTTEELLEVLETHDVKAFEFENRLRNESDITLDELHHYYKTIFITLLGQMKLNNLTVDEMLEECLDNLHK